MPIKAIQTEEDLAQPQQLMTHHNICSSNVELSIGAKHLMSSAPPSVERNDWWAVKPAPFRGSKWVCPCAALFWLKLIRLHQSHYWNWKCTVSPISGGLAFDLFELNTSLFSCLTLDLSSFFLSGSLDHTHFIKVSGAPPESHCASKADGIKCNQNPGPWFRPWCWRAGVKTLLATLWTLMGLSRWCHSSRSISAPPITCLFQFARHWPPVPPSLPPLHSSLALSGTLAAGCIYTHLMSVCAFVCAVGGKKWSLPLLHHSFLSLILSLPPSPGPINL